MNCWLFCVFTSLLCLLLSYIISNVSECLECVYVCVVQMVLVVVAVVLVVVGFKGNIRDKQTCKILEGSALIAWFRLSLP